MTGNEIVKTFGKSVLSRLGTAAAVWLLAKGVPQDIIDQIVQACAVLISLLVDMAFVLYFRGKVR